VTYHWRYFFFISYQEIPLHRSRYALFYTFCMAGHQAVVLFFVLSGYLISGSVFRTLDRGTWSWKSYLTHRLVRLWIVLIPGLLLCLLWDSIGAHYAHTPVMYHGHPANNMLEDVGANLTLRNFASNLFFLQGILTHTFGSDGPLWSLANEFWYYVLFPLGLFAIRPKSSTQLRVLCVVFFAGIAWLIGIEILEKFPLWLVGTALARMPTPRLTQRTRLVVTTCYVPVFFLLGIRFPLPLLAVDYLLAAATFGMLWVLLSATSAARPWAGERLSRELARFSYTLYLVHMPFSVLVASFLLGDARWFPDVPHLFFGAAILLLVIAYAYGVARLTEFHTDQVRRWIEARVLGRAADQLVASPGALVER